MRLKRLGYPDYGAYLRSPAWSAVKARYRASDLEQDCICGETDELHLHHLTYERVGEERVSDLTPLCRDCHSLVHVLERRGDLGLDPAPLSDKRRAAVNRLIERRRRAMATRDFNAEDVERHRRIMRLELPERLLFLRRAAARRHIDVSSMVRVVERQVERMERKVERATETG